MPNTVAKLSGLVTEAAPASWTPDDLRPYTDAALDAFGPGRLMFGSDWPVCTLAAGYARVCETARELRGAHGRVRGHRPPRLRPLSHPWDLCAAPASRVGGRYSRTNVRSQHAPVARSSRQVV
ncbi:amidohydrolase family protein [Streptomyces sp. SAS_269]|uniref:amidohydrolase family protein n=1 Tax=Streptomyces sp. SAS_269 TaxID=3412749 RepID=UPI00403D4190